MKSRIDCSDKFADVLKAYLARPDVLTNEIFRLPGVRDALTVDRFQNLFGSQIRQTSSESSSKVTIEHNTDLQRMFFAELSRRPDLISQVLATLNSVRQNASQMRVLSVGARTEAEVFSIVNAGFRLDLIECVDLFSYTPLIKIGDVHNLNYPDQYFDVVICGWVLEFCSDLPRACTELLRVTKPGRYIAIGGMHHPSSTNIAEYNRRKHHDDRVWYCSIDNIRKHFSVREEDFVFKSEIEREDQDKRGEVVAVFKKRNS